MAYSRGSSQASKKAVGKTQIPAKADDFFTHVREKYEDAQGNRTTWTQKQVRYNKLRMRVKKAKTFPFVGCSNLRMPTAEIKIRKTKAQLYNIIFGIRPIVTCIPPPNGRYETALKVEKLLDHIIVDRMRFKNRAVIAIDQELEQGMYLLMPYWKLEITKREEVFDIHDLTVDEVLFFFDGKTTDEMRREFMMSTFSIDMDPRIADENEANIAKVIAEIIGQKDRLKPVKFRVQDIVSDLPEIDLVSPERCYVPSDSGFDPQELSCAVIETFKPLRELQTNAEHFGWDIEGVNDISSYLGKDSRGLDTQREDNKDLLEGISRLNESSNLVRIWTYLGWYDVDNDGIDEKCISYLAPDFQKTLKKMALPFNSGKFNLVKLFYELTDNRWYAHRGIVELAEDLIKEIDTQHNQKIDQQTIRNAPMFIYRAGQINPNLVQLIPNQALPVRGMQPLRDTIDVLNNTNPNAEFSYINEQQSLEAKLEELTGQLDYTLQSQINRRQPRTLGEVEMQAQSVNQVFALDAGMHIDQFTELFNWVWDLWCQYGPDDYEFKYFGPNGYEDIRFSKEEAQGGYKVTVRGNDKNTNPQNRIQKASQIMLAATNPALIQSGVVTPPQQIAALKRFYQYLDVENWEELVNMQWQPPPPPPAASIIKPDFSELPDGEQMQVIASAGIQPDVQGRMMDKQLEMAEVMSEHAGKQKKQGAESAKK